MTSFVDEGVAEPAVPSVSGAGEAMRNGTMAWEMLWATLPPAVFELAGGCTDVVWSGSEDVPF